MRYSADYYRLKQIQDALFKIICDQKTPARDVARCVTAFINLERFRREIRGIPPLAPMKLNELPPKRSRSPLRPPRVSETPIEAVKKSAEEPFQIVPPLPTSFGHKSP